MRTPMVRSNHDQDVVIVGGVRTPFVRSWTVFERFHPVELGRFVAREAIERAEIDPSTIDEVIVGNIAGPADATNIGRVIALEAKIPRAVPGLTVQRNCASGMQAIADAAYRIRLGDADLVLVVAVESMTRAPLLFSEEARHRWTRIARAKGLFARLAALAKLRPRHFSPVSGLEQGLTDPVSGLNMGETAELLAREFSISREAQDRFAVESHRRAAAAWSAGRMADEVVPVPLPPEFETWADADNGVRPDSSEEKLARLRPVFDKRYGTVTPGNASQITDGAVALVLASGRRAAELRADVLGRIVSWAFVGCDPARMGLGPVVATPRALAAAGGIPLDRMDRVELNEAFAAQVLACMQAFDSRRYCEETFGIGPIGALDPARLNVNGGAIAYGHPVGATGARLVLTLLHELRRADREIGLATLCVGGGQGAAMVVERCE